MPEFEDVNDEKLTERAKKEDVYWLCECGKARLDIDILEPHLNMNNHYAEKINSKNGRVLGFIAGGLDNQKYGNQVPDSANIKREKRKNDPMFDR